MIIPNEPRPGDPLNAAWGCQVVRCLRALYPRPSADLLPSVGAGGTTFRMIVKNSPPGGASVILAFALYDASTTAGGVVTPNLGIRNGLIALGGGLVFAEGVTGMPTGMTVGGTPAFVLPLANTDQIAWILVDVTTPPTVDTVTIDAGAMTDLPGGSTTQAVIPLGPFNVAMSGGHVTGVNIDPDAKRGIGNQLVYPCAGGYLNGAYSA